MQKVMLNPATELHLLESLDKPSRTQRIEVYTEPEKTDGRRILDSCQS